MATDLSPLPLLGFLQSIGWQELLVIGVIAVLLFGRKLPDIGRSLGQTYVQFRRGLRDVGDDIQQSSGDAPKTSAPPAAPATPPSPAPSSPYPAASPSEGNVAVALESAGERPDELHRALAGELGVGVEEAARLAAALPLSLGRDVPLGVARRMKSTLEAAGGRVTFS